MTWEFRGRSGFPPGMIARKANSKADESARPEVFVDFGGLFFDDLNGWGFDRCFAYQRSVGDHFLEAYLPIVTRRKNVPWAERERQFQLYRRGRYVEFNLLYDRGTIFGLKTGGNVEAILMSLPPEAAWP